MLRKSIIKRKERSRCLTLLYGLLYFIGVVQCQSPYVNVKDNILNIPSYDLPHYQENDIPIVNKKYAFELSKNISNHKSLIPLNGRDIAAFVLAAIGLMFAAGGGIGGGGILVPIYTLVLKFTPKYAIPLSNVSVFGGAVANVLLNLRKRHPDADRPLVDWDLILVMLPLTLSGALIGALINKILPEWLLTSLLVIVLGFTTYRTLKKGKELYEKENEKRRIDREKPQDNEGTMLPTETSESLVGDDIHSQQHDIHPGLEMEDEEGLHSQAPIRKGITEMKLPLIIEEPSNKNEMTKSMAQLLLDESKNQIDIDQLAQILEEERHIPYMKVGAIFVLFIVVIVFNILKGGGPEPSLIGVRCGTVWFWIIQASLILWTIIFLLLAREYLMKRTKLKEEVNYPYVEGDIVWDSRATIIYPAICSVAGLCAGMFGIGGGIVKGPLMLAMGVHPMVAAATSATMILFTTFTATTSFIEFGLLQYDYAAVLVIIGFLATLIGQTLMNILIKKTGRNSYIIILIGVVVCLSAILMALQNFLTIKKTRAGHGTMNSGICGVGA